MQKCVKANYPPGDAKEDWKIFNMIYKIMKNDLLFKNFHDLREDSIKNIKNHKDFDVLPKINPKSIRSDKEDFFSENVNIKQIDYYFSNVIARSSKTMSDCKLARFNNQKSRN